MSKFFYEVLFSNVYYLCKMFGGYSRNKEGLIQHSKRLESLFVICIPHSGFKAIQNKWNKLYLAGLLQPLVG